MRKVIVAAATLVALAIALPAVSAYASERSPSKLKLSLIRKPRGTDLPPFDVPPTPPPEALGDPL